MQKTKVTIIVEGLGEQTVLVPFKDAVSIYTTAGQEIVNRLLNIHDIAPKVQLLEGIAEAVAPLQTFPMEHQPTNTPVEPEVKVRPMIVDKSEVRDAEVVHHTKANFIIKPFTADIFSVPKLVMAKCPHCGVVTCRKVILGQTEYLDCHFCKGEIEIEKVILTEATCPNCQKFVYFYSANDLTEISCKECESPIDIVYLKDERKALSASMIKHGKRHIVKG